jgi:tRNA A-37 threonylcarbamoyl transferase component Bud32
MTDIHLDADLSRSLAQSPASAAPLLSRRLWIWPLIAALFLVVIGLLGRARVDRAIHEKLAAELETILKADVAALQLWLESQKSNASAAARSADTPRLIAELIASSDRPEATSAELAGSPSARQLAAQLSPWLEELGYSGYFVADLDQRIVASHSAELLLKRALPGYSVFLPKVLSGTPTVSHPFPSVIILADATGRQSVGTPTMYAAAPVRDSEGKIIAALGLCLRPEIDFTRILSLARGGTTGETYAFNRQGLLLSESRFDDQLKQIGLIADRPESRSILQLELRDPGVDLTSGARPARSRSQMPLARAVADAAAGKSEVDMEGYRDYRGVKVVAASTWLPLYDFGVATQIDHDEADAPLYAIHPFFWGLFALLATSALAIFVFSLFVMRLRQRVQRAAHKARKLGQYTLEAKIGEGTMGAVYRGRHAMLRRPTAIKLLSPEKTTEVSMARFEREVRFTSQLTHPNTVGIYDFGRTPEGIFYYAMELIEGINLDSLVQTAGPLPEGRVIHILSQMCGSLAEAHELGLIHRDVKPANTMICRRGGMYDVVKLLDFGLVKAVDPDREAGLTAAGAITGTPIFMAPEAIGEPESSDRRSDLYSLGAVGYFLLTATTPFSAMSLLDLYRKHVDTAPEPPSVRVGRKLDPDLESLILRCLAKRPADRFASAEEIAEALRRCVSADTWSRAAARNWWQRRQVDRPTDSSIELAQRSVFGATVTSTALGDRDHWKPVA